MTDQWIRRVKLLVGDDAGNGIDLSDLRVRFTVSKGALETPNGAVITVSNPAPQTVSRFQKEFTRVVLNCGYAGNFNTIFDGRIIWKRFGRESQTDTFIEITAVDGDLGYSSGFVSHTLAAGYSRQDVHDVLADALLAQTQINPDYDQWSAPRGKTMFGMARDRMREHAASNGMIWSIQDGYAMVEAADSYVSGEAIEINYLTGMIGLPQLLLTGIQVRCLLNPAIKIKRLIKLDNNSIQDINVPPSLLGSGLVISKRSPINGDGLYQVMLLQHVGDTRGNDWYTDILSWPKDGAPGVAMPIGVVQGN